MKALPIADWKDFATGCENRLDVAMERVSMDVNACDLGKRNRQSAIGNRQ